MAEWWPLWGWDLLDGVTSCYSTAAPVVAYGSYMVREADPIVVGTCQLCRVCEYHEADGYWCGYYSWVGAKDD